MPNKSPPAASESLTEYDESNLPTALDGSEEEYVPQSPKDPVAIPYDRVNPPDIPYTEFNYAQRRAVILNRIEHVGHPRAMNQTYEDLAEEFDTVVSVIHNDMKVLAAFMAEHVSRDHVSIMDAVFRGAVRDLAEKEEWVDAAEVGKNWYEWLADMGAMERVADKVDLDATVRNVGDSEAYRVIDDDDAEAVEWRDAPEEEVTD